MALSCHVVFSVRSETIMVFYSASQRSILTELPAGARHATGTYRKQHLCENTSKHDVDTVTEPVSASVDVNDVGDLGPTFPDLEQRLQPVPPCVSLEESVQVYKEHCRMAREFHQVKHEISALEDRKRKLLAELVEDEKVAIEIARLEEEFRRLTEENHTLSTLHSCHVLRRLDEQRLRDALCDVTVLVEGHGFRAHRSVLAACSEYFAHRISSLTQQGAVIAAPSEVTAAGFEPLLKFAYTSKLLFSTDNVADIRKSASVLGFRDLEDACFDFLAPKLSGGDGPAAFLRKTCCQKKRKRRLSIEEAGTGPGDATRGDGELKAVADSSTQQETSRCCGESANSKMESRSGATQHYRQCPKYRRQLACEREICSRRQSLAAPATEDNLRNKEEEEKRRESTPNASTLADRAEDHERGPEIIKKETNETEGGSVEMGRDPHVTERCDAESAFLGSSFVLAEGSLGLILKRCPLTTFGEDPGSPGEGRFARHPKGEKLIRSPCVPAPTAVRQKTGRGQEDRQPAWREEP
ncbi:hypothetical protein fugu_009003 [Takifugu bimaculatus]|uniref:BTB domain-containing protein n=1 Tax=Takifugu bimaculatus TaxID=433685 RepID=A0A4Z2AYW2_9TELE|nr:hypothetical protein fugu_009003 [Takifugu bimaculatus]